MKKSLTLFIALCLLLSVFSVTAFAGAPQDSAAEEAQEEAQGMDGVDIFIFIAGGAVVVVALLMILIAYIKTRRH